jgi:magnesium chelatase accessory protein
LILLLSSLIDNGSRTLVPPTSIEAGGLRWRVRVAGHGPVLLLLHGTGASLESWDACVERLQDEYQLVVPDLPGHAGTQRFADGRCSLPRMAAALHTLLTQLALTPVLVAGHSAAAALALRWALDHRPSPAVLAVNAALEPLSGLAAWSYPALAEGLLRMPGVVGWLGQQIAQPARLRPLIASTGSRTDAAVLDRYAGLLQQQNHLLGCLEMMRGWRPEVLHPLLPALRTPVWLVAGGADRTVDPAESARWAGRLPQGRLLRLPGRGHLAHEEDPQAVAGLLRDLASSLRPAGGTAGAG